MTSDPTCKCTDVVPLHQYLCTVAPAILTCTHEHTSCSVDIITNTSERCRTSKRWVRPTGRYCKDATGVVQECTVAQHGVAQATTSTVSGCAEIQACLQQVERIVSLHPQYIVDILCVYVRASLSHMYSCSKYTVTRRITYPAHYCTNCVPSVLQTYYTCMVSSCMVTVCSILFHSAERYTCRPKQVRTPNDIMHMYSV